MKKEFFDQLFLLMKKNKDIYFLMAGLGYPRVDDFLTSFPDRAYNTEASEQSTLDIAVGLAYAGKKVVIYSITPFLLFRAFETIRTYINKEKLPIILVGAGRDDDYSEHDGFSHYAGDDKLFMQHFKNIISVWPISVPAMKKWLKIALENERPYYINLKR